MATQQSKTEQNITEKPFQRVTENLLIVPGIDDNVSALLRANDWPNRYF